MRMFELDRESGEGEKLADPGLPANC